MSIIIFKREKRIREVFDRLAPELNKKNKRFYVNSIKEGERAERLKHETLPEKMPYEIGKPIGFPIMETEN